MKNVIVAAKVPGAAHQLDPSRIIQTAEKLAQRIGQSLPGTTLAGLAAEIVQIARDTDQRIRQILKPNLAIRIGSVTAIGLTLACLWYFMQDLHTRLEFRTITEFLGAANTCFNFLVALAGGLWFFVTLESRIKRKKILASIQELRELIHVIDATQLYYTPEMYGPDSDSTKTDQRFDHTYLLDCSQLLGVISNLAALYTRGAADDSIMRAAADVEMLAAALTGKLYAKAEFVRLAA
ncbi:MAG: hypothetical protein NT069_25090 [Planctomycetota bacterium]|nr:hypothetical protein [Planctomycetota bacterium]